MSELQKRHFEAFAKEIRCSFWDLNTRATVAMAVGAVCQRFNSKFDLHRFMEASGAYDGTGS